MEPLTVRVTGSSMYSYLSEYKCRTGGRTDVVLDSLTNIENRLVFRKSEGFEYPQNRRKQGFLTPWTQ